MLRDRWERLLGACGVLVEQGEQVWCDLLEAYGGVGRYYHNLDHLEAVLAILDTLTPYMRRPSEVQLAAWFHDAVYDSRAADNEERSAVLAEAVCATWGLSADTAQRVGRLIRATKTHVAHDDDAMALLDADLAILGADRTDYDRYAAAIRREYAWVAEKDYQLGRARVLRGFLERDRIYRLEQMHTALDSRARDNLSRELTELGEE